MENATNRMELTNEILSLKMESIAMLCVADESELKHVIGGIIKFLFH